MGAEDSNDAILTRAIDVADDKTLRRVLKSMCKESETCRKAAMDRMLISRKHEIIEVSDSSDEDSDSYDEDDEDASDEDDASDKDSDHAEEKPNKKQKTAEADDATLTSRYAICETCEKVYDVTLNNKKACRTHDDILEIHRDYFPDDDQVRYDINSIDVDTDWRRDSVPEGFRWQCCDEPCNGKPCVIQRHIPQKCSAAVQYVNPGSVTTSTLLIHE